jgi:hypothetical protein
MMDENVMQGELTIPILLKPMYESAKRFPNEYMGSAPFYNQKNVEIIERIARLEANLALQVQDTERWRTQCEKAQAELDSHQALMELACSDIIFFHDQGSPFTGPETPELPSKVEFSVLVNDTFVPAADCEGFDISEAIPLRDIFRKGGIDAVIRWVQQKRDGMPLRPHIEKQVKDRESLRAQLDPPAHVIDSGLKP